MLLHKIFPPQTFPALKYVVVFSRYQGQWLLSRHRQRTTWETQGGHIEEGETPMAAARRELYEESGAEESTLRYVCDYWCGDRTSSGVGAVFLADITRLGPLPESEMAEVRTFDALPDNLTYPDITPYLYETVIKHLAQPDSASGTPKGTDQCACGTPD